MKITLTSLISLLFVACATSDKKDAINSTLINGSMDKAKAVAEKAYADLGFSLIGKDSKCFTGEKSMKPGLWTSSGGEKVVTCFTENGSRTDVQVQTKYSFVGYLGQESWDSRFIQKINELNSK